MVEANPGDAAMSNATIDNPETVVHFYERSSGFTQLRQVKNVSSCTSNTHLGHPLHYPMKICQNKSFPSDLLIANTNFSVRIMNLESGALTSLEGDQHTKPITALHCPEAFQSNENLQHVFMTASEDGLVKIWDRRSSSSVAQCNSGGGKSPFYSVGTNQSMIAAGTDKDVLVWDIHKLQKPIGRFVECHNDDVTAVKFCPMASDMMITCSIDNVLSMFDFKNHVGPSPRLKEEDLIDGAYSSVQAMIDCGFITPEIIYAVTSINTVEFIRVADANCFLTLASFPHDVTFLIGVEVVTGTYAAGELFKVLVYGGNMQGEVYIYEVTNVLDAFSSHDDAMGMQVAALNLVDMILTQEPYAIRQVTQVGEEVFALCSESNKVTLMRHNPQLKAQQNLQAQAKLLQELEDDL